MNRITSAALYTTVAVLIVAILIATVGIKVVANLAIIETFLATIAFVVVYVRRNWQRSAVGWNLMAFGVVLLVVTGLAVLTLLFGVQWPYRDWIRAFSWALVGGVLTWRVALLFTTHPPPVTVDPTPVTVDPTTVLVRCPHYPRCSCTGPIREEQVDD